MTPEEKMLSLLTNRYVIFAILAAVLSGSIYFMYWNMDRWRTKAQEYEVQLEAMTAARDLLLELDAARAGNDRNQANRREEIEKKISTGDRGYFQ
jgi:hypothetical protein